MRIATFNVLNGRAPDETSVDEQRFRHALAALDADVLALQEVDRHQPRSDHLDLAAVAAEAMGAVAHLFVAALSGTPSTWSGADGHEPDDTPAYGIALLSRYPVTDWQVLRLPPAPIRVPYRFERGRRPEWVRDEPRVALQAGVDTPHGRLRLVTTHLSFLPVWNGRQLQRLVHGLDRSDDPTVLLGDLNMGPRRAARLTRMTPLASGPTFPATRPVRQLDHILGDRPLPCSDGGPVALEVSDHRALVAELTG